MPTQQERAVIELNRLKDEFGTWRSVGIHIANLVGGTSNTWMVITNAVANGNRKANHKLLVALGIRKRRRRFSCDVPSWMDSGDEEMFSAIMRGSAKGAEAYVKANRDKSKHLEIYQNIWRFENE